MSGTASPRVRTSAGIEIGGAYIPRPPAPSADAEAIQAALLDKRRSHLLGAHGAMRKALAPKLSEAELDARILELRDRHETALEEIARDPDARQWLSQQDLDRLDRMLEPQPLPPAMRRIVVAIMLVAAALSILLAWQHGAP